MSYASVWSRSVTDEIRDGVKIFLTWAQTAGQWLVIACVALVWLTGGIHPQTQTQYEELSRQNVEMARQVSDLQRTLTAVNDKISLMPRQSDYVAQDNHLSRLDAEISALGDRMTADEIRASAADARTQRLIDTTDQRAKGAR
jgi:hypothetical protein